MSILSIKELETFIKSESIVAVVFSTHTCKVCQPLKAKIGSMAEELNIAYDDIFIDDLEMAQGLYQIYTSPIVLLFVEGRESKRYSAAIDMKDIYTSIKRYKMLLS